MHLPFVLKAANRNDLCNALVKEYGAAQGGMLYNHLKSIFQSQEEPSSEPEKPAKVTRTRRGGRRKKTAAEPTE